MADIVIYTNSKHVIQGMTKWRLHWVKRSLWNGKSEPVTNREIWERLICLCEDCKILWRWVKGHSDDQFNDFVNELLQNALKRTRQMEVA